MSVKTSVTADAAVRLMLHFPFWSELYYSMNVLADETLPTMATNEKVMWVNPEFWRGLNLDLKVAALAHEVEHKMRHHCSRMHSDYDPFISNIAMDIVVNQSLVDNGFKLAPTWVQPVPEYKGWTWEAIYQDIIRKLPPPPKGPGRCKPPPKDGQGNSDGPGEPGDSPYADHPDIPEQWKKVMRDIRKTPGSKDEIERHEQEVEQAVQKALATAKAMGHAPLGIEDQLAVTYKVASEPWYNHLHRFFQALVVSEFNWARYNKRYMTVHRIFAPANFSEALGEVVLFRDTSGSCFDRAQQAQFMEHVWAILAECKPQKVHIIDFDAAVHQHVELDVGDTEPVIDPKGGGGTSFVPLFEFIEDEGIEPVVAIVLTDMMGTFPSTGPAYPVIWANVFDEHTVGPFGETLFVK